ncbi:restriction endonuclease subunit S [Salmonella enterica]|nr:restriction endonuclease subunit S [Salmonella enterica]
MKYRAYSEYKDSCVEWLGEIPARWTLEKFKYLFQVSNEKNGVEPVGQMLSVSGYRGVEIKEYNDDAKKRTLEEVAEYRVVRKGQLVVNTMWLNYSGLGVSEYEGYVSPAYRAYFLTEHVNKRYIHHLLRSAAYVMAYTAQIQGIRPNSLQIKTDDFQSLPILLPSIIEQEYIASFLDYELSKIDRLIRMQEQLIELLKEKRQAVISHAVTNGLNPDVKLKYSGIEWLGNLPEHWEVTRLKYECSKIVDCLHSTPEYSDIGQFPAIRTADIISGFLDVENAKKVSEEVFLERNSRLTPIPGDVIYSREGERFGIAACVPEGAKVCLGQRVMLFRVKKCSLYYMWAINASSTYEQALQDVIGATSPHINVETIKNFYLPRPPIKEQEEISKYIQLKINKFDKLVDIASNKISLLQERRSALISSTVTGKIDVRNWQPDAKDVA